MSTSIARAVFLALMSPTVVWAQLASGRLVPGNFPAPFLDALAAAPKLDEVENGGSRWLPFMDNHANQSYPMQRGAVTLAQRATWDAQMRAMLDQLRTTPVLSRSLGRAYRSSSSMSLVGDEYFGRGGARAAPLSGTLDIGSFGPNDVVTGPNGRLRLVPGAHTFHFKLVVNEIPSIWPWKRDSTSNIFPLRVDARLDGLPMHGHQLVLTRNGRSPYAPVSWERAIAAFLASHLGDSESAPEARALLARLTPTERRQQAWVCDDESRWLSEHCFVEAGTTGGVPLVAIDTTFFDPTLPRTAIQIITVSDLSNTAKGSEDHRDPNNFYAIALALFQTVDWRAFRDRFVR